MGSVRRTETGIRGLESRTRAGVAPASRYADPDYLALERERVFARAWLVAGPSHRVDGPGRYFTFDHLGQHLVVLRDKGGELRAFHNTCRHRGTRLLDGLAAIDKRELSLLPVKVAEALGFVWISFDPDAPPLLETLGPVADEVAPYRLEEMRPIQEITWTKPCNWKAVLDNASESYHIPVVHRQSLQSRIDDLPRFSAVGDHARLTLAIGDTPWRRWLDRRTTRGGPYTERQRAALQKYVLFPNFLMNLVPCHLTVFQVWPVDATRCRFFYGFYGRRGAGPLEWLRARATWLASRYILREDLRILERFQRGAEAGQVREHRFHEGEAAIDHFHRVLERWIGE